MRVVLQRVSRASVSVGGEQVAAIGPGFLALVGVAGGDDVGDVVAAVEKVSGLRVFADAEGKMNRSIVGAGGEILVVSQFTLLADIRRGRRPSFTDAAAPAVAEPLIEEMVAGFRAAGIPTSHGVFGASMQVELVNDGPVTLVFDVLDGKPG
ncbi:MAG: D-aminoacyl-tRNA deacylase [Acidimicrobiia bacterium]|jgi:D-tyrosyl-tRNA(Tyr) deacylase